MAQLGQHFDPADVPPSDNDYDLLPNGSYEAQITESEVALTKAGNGQMLNLTWTIVNGPFTNRKVWQRLNIQNQSHDAQRIGQQQLAAICEATGAGAISDSEELHFRPCLISVGVEKDKTGEYQDKNKVTRVKPLGGSAAAPRPQQQRPAQQPARQAAPQQRTPAPARPSGGATRPWNSPRQQHPTIEDEIPF